jgi:hypothetical protein
MEKVWSADWKWTNLHKRNEESYLTVTVQTFWAELAISRRTLTRDADQLGPEFSVSWTPISISFIKVHSYFCLATLIASLKIWLCSNTFLLEYISSGSWSHSFSYLNASAIRANIVNFRRTWNYHRINVLTHKFRREWGRSPAFSPLGTPNYEECKPAYDDVTCAAI